MSHKRQKGIFDPRHRAGAVISTLTYSYKNGHRVPGHFHEEDQLLYGTDGAMAVTTEDGMWIVPPNRAVWIPANTSHSIVMSGPLTMKTLYLRPRLAKRLGRECRVLNISPLMRELLLEACRLEALYRRIPAHGRLIGVILDQMQEALSVPLRIPMPRDLRAAKLAAMVLADAGDRRPLAALCRSCGASKRTMERLFREETGLTVGRWRQQAGLARAIQLLAAGDQVTSIALEAGYSSPSAFIAMFRKTLGTTPARYLGV
jgi:AraC-like DNA-binding protein/mannose-6-phosphate isomerase-like protein (cupin superfamily)